ncbi:glycerol-3-phosphate acyltransferase [Lactococcus lactis subsp. lactis]|uniref:Glycerol-3-phosphate acyltransferase n=1 Tax=Lactococcus lactis subsp. lactis TaxID=1360 RepID=A0A1V0NFG9_LACLL|nr:glycerol-3-phosphate 1-O-acyltransferase PlsY [Lactococcus lactis]MRL87877.1 glycerol-3-phosphate 1-O-acyltransferase PlsY [Lactococcus cremoris]ADZ63593.1 glycerol-3-phosphate acyltransferase PlsY [Lactococcus lactis subsp. lactis CV56]ARD98691.1 acyl-phosphate glycerol-3-phosphate acyltransferase [Lactococcus lactis subsp. lactis]EHE93504.1 Glycerol-3-phosphate O-acyltransferase [Lactococcus lactis subsp. lactis CNCM I-1631]KAF0954340.1 glycerol-3-phosphate acyltransferase [Lactococcus la
MLTIILLLIASYLLGAIPFGLWIGKIFFKKNLHDYGSGNTGTTNTFRILGVKAGISVFAFDLLKGTLATLLPLFFHINGVSPLIFGLLAVIGHTFSIFDRFKGGKAVATSAGVILGFSPLFLIYLLVVFIIVLWLFSMISLSSVIGAVFASLGILIFPSIGFILTSYDLLFSIIIFVLAIIIILRHRTNLKRIKNHCESLVPFGLNLSKQKEK